MIFEGKHKTTYAYSEAVFLEPHTVRLRPRSDPRQTVREFSIEVTPTPDGITQGIDANGNSVAWTWFSGKHSTLEISTHFVVETSRSNPFDFVVPTKDGAQIPPPYSADEQRSLAPFLSAEDSSLVKALAEELREQAGREVVPFLQALATRLYESHEVVVREEGDPLPGAETLRTGVGSCRDLTVLFMDVCRHVGVAARFVSGYQEGDPDQVRRDLHAWAGAYIPGAGWRGYDPTHGLAVADRHITLAAAATSAGAAPTTGSFRGTGASAKLTAEIDLKVKS